MKLLISPSKAINYDVDINYPLYSSPYFLGESKKLIKILKNFSSDEISKMMKISDNLANLNHKRYQDFSTPFNEGNSKPAIFIFNGDVYNAIRLESYKESDFEFMQDSLRILSGLYGILRPLDLIQPYRLEMSTKLQNDRGRNLYEFWGGGLSSFLNDDNKKQEVVINLASAEYFDAIKSDKVNAKIIKIDFKENKSGKLKIIGLMAKRARGEMVNYIIKNKITNSQDIKEFNINGYGFDSQLSSSELYVFTR